MPDLPRAEIKGQYAQRSIRDRLESFFLDNIGKVATREQILEVARDPKTGEEPENWHQRLSELRTDKGYTIQSWRDRKDLKVGEYLLASAERRKTAGTRVRPSRECWRQVMARSGNRCEWSEAREICGLKEGELDPIGGGTVRLQPDHKRPHAIHPDRDPEDPECWQALCGRHQVVKKNFWDSTTGKLNVYAIVQCAGIEVKREIYRFLKSFFDDA